MLDPSLIESKPCFCDEKEGFVPNRIGNTGTGRRTVVGGGVEDTTGRTMVNLSAVRHQALSALRRIRARSVVAARPRVMSVIVEGSGTGVGTSLKS
jgi:hypothetical protein